MSPTFQYVVLVLLIFISAYLSCAEISLAAARRPRLETLAEDGDKRAKAVLELQEHPGQFFSAIQIGTNAVALLGGIVGNEAFSPMFKSLFERLLPPDTLSQVVFLLSFTISTALFVLFADLLPKRIAVARP